MQPNRPRNLLLIIALQFVTVVLLPPDALRGMGPAIAGAIVVLFAVLGVALYRLRAWARTATIFLQGMNIIVRLLVLLPGVTTAAGGLNYWLLGVSAISMALSALILYEIEKPEIQMLMQ
jgi:hypothetical protein